MTTADRVPFLSGYPFVAVRANLNGAVGARLLVDTGAQGVVISRSIAALLGLDLNRPLHTQPLVGVGQAVAMPVVRLNRVQVGSSAAANLSAAVYDLPPFFRVDGLLGLTFLRRFRATFEFDTRTLVLRSFPAASTR